MSCSVLTREQALQCARKRAASENYLAVQGNIAYMMRAKGIGTAVWLQRYCS